MWFIIINSNDSLPLLYGFLDVNAPSEKCCTVPPGHRHNIFSMCSPQLIFPTKFDGSQLDNSFTWCAFTYFSAAVLYFAMYFSFALLSVPRRIIRIWSSATIFTEISSSILLPLPASLHAESCKNNNKYPYQVWRFWKYSTAKLARKWITNSELNCHRA